MMLYILWLNSFSLELGSQQLDNGIEAEVSTLAITPSDLGNCSSLCNLEFSRIMGLVSKNGELSPGDTVKVLLE